MSNGLSQDRERPFSLVGVTGIEPIDGELLLHRSAANNGEDCGPAKVDASTIRGLLPCPTLTGVGPTGTRCPCLRSARPRPGRCGASAGPRMCLREDTCAVGAHLPALTIARCRVEHPTQPALDATGVRVDGSLVSVEPSLGGALRSVTNDFSASSTAYLRSTLVLVRPYHLH